MMMMIMTVITIMIMMILTTEFVNCFKNSGRLFWWMNCLHVSVAVRPTR